MDTYKAAKRIMNNGNWPSMVEVMDDDLREQLHREADCDDDFEFCEAYLAATTYKDLYSMIKSFAAPTDWYKVREFEDIEILTRAARVQYRSHDLEIYSNTEDPEQADRFEVRFHDGMVSATDLTKEQLDELFREMGER